MSQRRNPLHQQRQQQSLRSQQPQPLPPPHPYIPAVLPRSQPLQRGMRTDHSSLRQRTENSLSQIGQQSSIESSSDMRNRASYSQRTESQILNQPSQRRNRALYGTTASMLVQNSSLPIQQAANGGSTQVRRSLNHLETIEWDYRTQQHFYEFLYHVILMSIFCLLTSVVCFQKLNPCIPVAFLFVHDILGFYRIYQLASLYVHSQNQLRIKLLATETTAILIAKIILIIHLLDTESIKAIFVLIPVSVYSVVRIFLLKIERKSEDCNSVINFCMVGQRIFVFLITLSLCMKLDGSVQWDWQQSIWSFWILFSVLIGLTFGAILLLINKIFQYCINEISKSELKGTIWTFFNLVGITGGSCLLFFGVAKYLDHEEQYYLITLCITVVVFLSIIIVMSIVWKIDIIIFLKSMSSFDQTYNRNRRNPNSITHTTSDQTNQQQQQIHSRATIPFSDPALQDEERQNRESQIREQELLEQVQHANLELQLANNLKIDEEEEEEEIQPLSIPRFLEKFSNTFFKKFDPKESQRKYISPKMPQNQAKPKESKRTNNQDIPSSRTTLNSKVTKHNRSISAYVSTNPNQQQAPLPSLPQQQLPQQPKKSSQKFSDFITQLKNSFSRPFSQSQQQKEEKQSANRLPQTEQNEETDQISRNNKHQVEMIEFSESQDSEMNLPETSKELPTEQNQTYPFVEEIRENNNIHAIDQNVEIINQSLPAEGETNNREIRKSDQLNNCMLSQTPTVVRQLPRNHTSSKNTKHRRFLSEQINLNRANQNSPQINEGNIDLPIFEKASEEEYDKESQRNRIETSTSRDIEGSELDKSTVTCFVCFDNMPDSVYMNCGHGGLCYACALDIWKKTGECYLCRLVLQIDITKKVRGLIKVISSTQMFEGQPPPFIDQEQRQAQQEEELSQVQAANNFEHQN